MLVPLFLLALCGASWAEKHIYHTYNRTILDETEYKQIVDEGVAQLMLLPITQLYFLSRLVRHPREEKGRHILSRVCTDDIWVDIANKVIDAFTFKRFCTIEVEDCVATEGRRLDGTCNNLQAPTMGATRTPMLRFLPADYADGLKVPRKAQSGEELPNGREVRTKLLFEGRVSDRYLSNLLPQLWLLYAADSTFVQDTLNYMYNDVPCCSAEGRDKNKCVPLEIPAKDPIHRFSGHRCMNLTIPLSFQNTGCLANGTIAEERTNAATPLFDLSLVYGSSLNTSLEKIRKYEDGLLKYEEHDGNIWPPNSQDYSKCTQNVAPLESRCHDIADSATNSLLGINLGTIWFYRQHNRLAGELKELNPCWDDEKLFYTARDINIALAAQIYYYEMLPLVLGEENMISHGVISYYTGFRDIYDENVLPQVLVEYLYALRWVHTITEGDLRLYDNEGNHYKNFPVVNATFRTGWLAIDDNIGGITRGLFRQAAGKSGDNIVEPDLAENALGALLDMHDIITADNLKSRYFGYKPYVEYLSKCSGKTYSTFDDLRDVISEEKIELLQSVYTAVTDIDLMAGMWMENNVHGGHSPPTFVCLVGDQLKRNIVSDRHWYEREDRPNAFTLEQLLEVRKASVARLMCTVGDNITKVQLRPLERPGPGNEIVDCDETQDIDMSVWKDNTCSS